MGDTTASDSWRTRWQRFAQCHGRTPDFYPGRGSTATVPDPEGDQAEHMAAASCAGCPVEFVCLDEGMSEAHGVWGGFVAENRAITRRWGHPCPNCEAPIRKGLPKMFCTDECVEAAVFADGEELELIGKRIDDLNARASLQNRLRKP